MLAAILLIYIGTKFDAAVWYYILCTILFAVNAVKTLSDLDRL